MDPSFCKRKCSGRWTWPVGLIGIWLVGGYAGELLWAAAFLDPADQDHSRAAAPAESFPSPPGHIAAEAAALEVSPKVGANSGGDLPAVSQSGQTGPKESADSAEVKPSPPKATPLPESDEMPLPPKPTPPSPPDQPPPAPEAPEPPETTQSLQKLFDAFLEKPTKETYFQVLDALCRHPAYHPYSTELEEVARLLESRRYDEAKAKLDQAMPNLILSPRAHNYYRVIAEAAGDAQEAQRRDQIAQKCLQGIQATGQGMVDAAGGEPKQGQVPAAPFHVARVSDEYDLVRALGKRVRVHSQSLRRLDGRWYDVLRCSDETGQVFYIWFDVTRPMSALKRQIQQSPVQPHDKENPP